jgi:hypothetical protein
MPRLVGKRSRAPLYLLMVLLVAVAAAAELEYAGNIDLIPGYGRENPRMRLSDSQNPRLY